MQTKPTEQTKRTTKQANEPYRVPTDSVEWGTCIMIYVCTNTHVIWLWTIGSAKSQRHGTVYALPIEYRPYYAPYTIALSREVRSHSDTVRTR